MASVDITAFDTVVKGVNSPNCYIRSEAHLIDGSEYSSFGSLRTLPPSSSIEWNPIDSQNFVDSMRL